MGTGDELPTSIFKSEILVFQNFSVSNLMGKRQLFLKIFQRKTIWDSFDNLKVDLKRSGYFFNLSLGKVI